MMINYCSSLNFQVYIHNLTISSKIKYVDVDEVYSSVAAWCMIQRGKKDDKHQKLNFIYKECENNKEQGVWNNRVVLQK